MSMLEGFITENSTETQILSFIESYCNILPSPYNQICIQGIADNGPYIIQQLINAENPTIVCQQLGLCTAASKVHPTPKLVKAVFKPVAKPKQHPGFY